MTSNVLELLEGKTERKTRFFKIRPVKTNQGNKVVYLNELEGRKDEVLFEVKGQRFTVGDFLHFVSSLPKGKNGCLDYKIVKDYLKGMKLLAKRGLLKKNVDGKCVFVLNKNVNPIVFINRTTGTYDKNVMESVLRKIRENGWKYKAEDVFREALNGDKTIFLDSSVVVEIAKAMQKEPVFSRFCKLLSNREALFTRGVFSIGGKIETSLLYGDVTPNVGGALALKKCGEPTMKLGMEYGPSTVQPQKLALKGVVRIGAVGATVEKKGFFLTTWISKGLKFIVGAGKVLLGIESGAWVGGFNLKSIGRMVAKGVGKFKDALYGAFVWPIFALSEFNAMIGSAFEREKTGIGFFERTWLFLSGFFSPTTIIKTAVKEVIVRPFKTVVNLINAFFPKTSTREKEQDIAMQKFKDNKRRLERMMKEKEKELNKYRNFVSKATKILIEIKLRSENDWERNRDAYVKKLGELEKELNTLEKNLEKEKQNAQDEKKKEKIDAALKAINNIQEKINYVRNQLEKTQDHVYYSGIEKAIFNKLINQNLEGVFCSFSLYDNIKENLLQAVEDIDENMDKLIDALEDAKLDKKTINVIKNEKKAVKASWRDYWNEKKPFVKLLDRVGSGLKEVEDIKKEKQQIEAIRSLKEDNEELISKKARVMEKYFLIKQAQEELQDEHLFTARRLMEKAKLLSDNPVEKAELDYTIDNIAWQSANRSIFARKKPVEQMIEKKIRLALSIIRRAKDKDAQNNPTEEEWMWAKYYLSLKLIKSLSLKRDGTYYLCTYIPPELLDEVISALGKEDILSPPSLSSSSQKTNNFYSLIVRVENTDSMAYFFTRDREGRENYVREMLEDMKKQPTLFFSFDPSKVSEKDIEDFLDDITMLEEDLSILLSSDEEVLLKALYPKLDKQSVENKRGFVKARLDRIKSHLVGKNGIFPLHPNTVKNFFIAWLNSKKKLQKEPKQRRRAALLALWNNELKKEKIYVKWINAIDKIKGEKNKYK